eukprot:6188588-Pleurochrysis_carterae.AAC.1
MVWYQPGENLGSELLREFEQLAWLLMQQQKRHMLGRTRNFSTSRDLSASLPHEFKPSAIKQ